MPQIVQYLIEDGESHLKEDGDIAGGGALVYLPEMFMPMGVTLNQDNYRQLVCHFLVDDGVMVKRRLICLREGRGVEEFARFKPCIIGTVWVPEIGGHPAKFTGHHTYVAIIDQLERDKEAPGPVGQVTRADGTVD